VNWRVDHACHNRWLCRHNNLALALSAPAKAADVIKLGAPWRFGPLADEAKSRTWSEDVAQEGQRRGRHQRRRQKMPVELVV
jgi:hypothetical protein